MALTIGSNIASFRAQRALGNVSKSQESTFERLSSGLRINRAADDAAGLAVSSSLNIGARVYTQAQRNLSDGTSMLSIADGAAEQLQKVLDRQSELAAQSANGVYSDLQRKALDVEFQQLSLEYNRIIRTTEFNGSRLFDTRATTFQAGFGIDETLRLALGEQVRRLPTGVIRVSQNSNGTESGGFTATTNDVGMSDDGRYVVFTSQPDTLVTGDSNGFRDAYIHDTVLRTTSLVSTNSQGAASNGTSTGVQISNDGRIATFISVATNLVAGDANGFIDLFQKNLVTGETTLVSTAADGTQGNGHVNSGFQYSIATSGDGRYVVFKSNANNLVSGDTNGIADLFVKDTQTGAIVRANTTSTGAQTTGNPGNFSISDNGRYVAFTSSSTDTVTGDTNGVDDMFVKDLWTGQVTIASTSSSGVQGNAFASASSISGDGKYVAFNSGATNLVSGDSNGVFDIFVKNMQTGEMVLASSSATGVIGNGNSGHASLSADGRYVTFQSLASNLVEGDTNGSNDVFVKDLLTGGIERVSVDYQGGQLANGAVAALGTTISADGRFTLFNTSNPVTQGDSPTTQNLYMIRRDGESTSSSVALADHHGLYITSQISARYALERLNLYREELGAVRSDIGSGMSRFQVAGRTLQVRTENYLAAKSRITDVDVAQESSQLVRQGILQQAASAVLAQANQQPGLALSLLRG